MEVTLYKTCGDIEWYQIEENEFEGFNKKSESWQYVLYKDECKLWILIGCGKATSSEDVDELMNMVS